ncbi:hypothetical protein HDU67_009220 [Dinochytrium kinnereticum]|nr:hypothetical protein HDU67_009220 [Dinochytrium kinnereticum]
MVPPVPPLISNDYYPIVASRRNVLIEAAYTASGSNAGRLAMINNRNSISFGVSDGNITDSEMAASNYELRLIPIISGAVALVYYIPGLNGSSITLSRESIVGIFNGTITQWNHALLLRDNSGSPDVERALRGVAGEIQLVVREDACASTETLTRALASFDENWRRENGVYFSDKSHWPRSSRSFIGIANLMVGVLRTPNSIGYVDLSAASKYNASMARIVNRAGNVVSPNVTTIARALEDHESTISSIRTDRFFMPLVDGAGDESYPLTSFSYLVVRVNNLPSCDHAYEMIRYILWMITDSKARELATESYFVPLPPHLQTTAISILKELTCTNNIQLVDRAYFDIYIESTDINNVVFVSGVVVSFGIFVFVFIALVIYWHNRRKGVTKDAAIYTAEQLQLADEMEEINPSLRMHRSISNKWSGSIYMGKMALVLINVFFDAAIVVLNPNVDVSKEVFAYKDLKFGRNVSYAYLGLILIGGVLQFIYLTSRFVLLSFECKHRDAEIPILRLLILSIKRPPTSDIPTFKTEHIQLASRYVFTKFAVEVAEKAVTLFKQIPIIILSTTMLYAGDTLSILVIVALLIETASLDTRLHRVLPAIKDRLASGSWLRRLEMTGLPSAQPHAVPALKRGGDEAQQHHHPVIVKSAAQ